MKRILFFSMLLAIGSLSQAQNEKLKPTGIIDLSEKLRSKFAAASETSQGESPKKSNQPEQLVPAGKSTNVNAVGSPTIQWKGIASSMNIYGVLLSQGRPLNYNDELNAVSFIHRKGNSSGTTYPVNNSGSMIMRITNDWGLNWDSTCIWTDATNLGRYPQGGLYNAPGNTNMNNAFVVGMGPITNNNVWTGNWYASKQAGTGNYNYTASAQPNAQQFIANTPPYQAGLAKHDFSRYSFTSTDDGAIRSLAARYDSVINGAPAKVRGAAIVKGTFNAGVFNWTSDTLIPPVISKTDGYKQLWDEPIMAWNDAGNIGYVVFIGARSSASLSNRGWQPIVYKTTNSGNSWSLLSEIDFNNVTMQNVKDHLPNVNNDTALTIPFFNVSEGYDAVVDVSGKLHIISTIVGTARAHDDSLTYTYQYGAAKYSWGHVPGDRPYVYDFIGDGQSAWTCLTIDSLSSEGCGARSTDPGYNENPWDPDPSNSNNKVVSDSRLQAARTPDGSYIVYSWAESDTNFTQAYTKWNAIPNIKARCLASVAGNSITNLFANEINVTRPSTVVPVTYSNNPNVSSRAMFHYQSPKVRFISGFGTSSVTIQVPYTVSNSNPYSQLGENKHWYTTAKLPFAGFVTIIGLPEQKQSEINFNVYPNPAGSSCYVQYNLKNEGRVKITLNNLLGQEVRSYVADGSSGENIFSTELNNLNPGVYLLKVKCGNSETVKKLVVE